MLPFLKERGGKPCVCIYLHQKTQKQWVKVGPCIFQEGTGQHVGENQTT